MIFRSVTPALPHFKPCKLPVKLQQMLAKASACASCPRRPPA